MHRLWTILSAALLASVLLGASCLSTGTGGAGGPGEGVSGLLMEKAAEIQETAAADMVAAGLDPETAPLDEVGPYLEAAARQVLADAGLELLEGEGFGGMSWAEIVGILLALKSGEFTLRGLLTGRGRANLGGLLAALNPDVNGRIEWGEVVRRTLAVEGWQHTDRPPAPPATP